MAEAAVRTRGERAGQGSRSSQRDLPGLRVRYFKRMSVQRVYPVTVEWEKGAERVPGAAPVTLRLLMAGAQVVPSEKKINPSNPNAKVTFFVTPLAKGMLRGERLEVVVGGRKVEEVPLPVRVATHRWTCTFLILAVLLPWLLISFCRYSPLTSQPHDVPENDELLVNDAGDAMHKAIIRELPDMPEVVDENVPQIQQGIDTFTRGVGFRYATFVKWIRVENRPIPFYVGVGFFFLALISWWFNSDRRKRKYVKSIPVPRGA